MIPINFSYPRSGNVESFDYYASVNIANGNSGEIVAAQLGAAFKQGYITALGIGIDDPSAFVGSIFSVRVNGNPDRYYQSIQDQLAPFSEPREIAPILIKPNDRITVFVVNNNAASKLYAARLRGFFDFALGLK
jgi:hypothetical protein